jgi:hypothetical protein
MSEPKTMRQFHNITNENPVKLIFIAIPGLYFLVSTRKYLVRRGSG